MAQNWLTLWKYVKFLWHSRIVTKISGIKELSILLKNQPYPTVRNASFFIYLGFWGMAQFSAAAEKNTLSQETTTGKCRTRAVTRNNQERREPDDI